MMQRSLKIRLGAVYPVKGSELLPPDSSGYELEVRNAILLYENWSTIARNECNGEVHTRYITSIRNNNTRKEILKLKQVIESNRVQEKIKATMTQNNRKHKMFVSRFEPPLYSPPSPPWRVSTIHRGRLQRSTKDPSTELHNLQWPLPKRCLHKMRNSTSNQSDHNLITKLFTISHSFTTS